MGIAHAGLWRGLGSGAATLRPSIHGRIPDKPRDRDPDRRAPTGSSGISHRISVIACLVTRHGRAARFPPEKMDWEQILYHGFRSRLGEALEP